MLFKTKKPNFLLLLSFEITPVIHSIIQLPTTNLKRFGQKVSQEYF